MAGEIKTLENFCQCLVKVNIQIVHDPVISLLFIHFPYTCYVYQNMYESFQTCLVVGQIYISNAVQYSNEQVDCDEFMHWNSMQQ